MRTLSWRHTIAFALLAILTSFSFGATPSTSSTVSPSARPSNLPNSELPLKFNAHERIALVGNSLAERMNLFGNFEALLQARFPQLELVVRNFARPCDAVDNLQRP